MVWDKIKKYEGGMGDMWITSRDYGVSGEIVRGWSNRRGWPQVVFQLNIVFRPHSAPSLQQAYCTLREAKEGFEAACTGYRKGREAVQGEV